MAHAQSLTKNTFYLTGAYVIQKVLTYVYFMVVARAFGPSQQGDYSTALSFASIFGVAIDLGFASVLTREISRDTQRAGHYLTQALILRGALSLIVYGLAMISAYAAGMSGDVRTMVALAFIATILDVMSLSCWAVFRGYHNLKYESISVLMVTATMVGLGILFIMRGFPIVYLVLAVTAASAVNLIYVLYLLIVRMGLRLTKFDAALTKKLFILSLPFALGSAFSRIYTNIDVIILNKMAGREYSGWYSAANKVILALQFLPAAVSASIYPVMSKYYAEDNWNGISRTYRQAVVYLLLLVIPIASALIVLGGPIATISFGESYAPTGALLQILAVALVSAFLFFPQGSLMAAIDRQKSNTIIQGVGAVANVVLNLILIYYYQAVGAAIVSSLTYLGMTVANACMTYRAWKTEQAALALVTLKITASSLVMGLVLYFTAPFLLVHIPGLVGAMGAHTRLAILLISWFCVIGLGAIVYCAGILATRALLIRDMKGLLKGIVHKEKATLENLYEENTIDHS